MQKCCTDAILYHCICISVSVLMVLWLKKSHQSASALTAVTHIFFGLDPGNKRLFMIVLSVCSWKRKQQYLLM